MDFVSAGEGSSGRSSVLNDPSIVSNQPQMKALGASLALMHPLPDVPSSADLISNVVGADFNSVLTGSKTTDQAAKDMQSGSEALLKKAGR
jgi:ABC-type glycerol-3-phosphate transport system substrate-binding protein